MSFYSNRGRYQKSRRVDIVWILFLVVTILLCVLAGMMAWSLWSGTENEQAGAATTAPPNTTLPQTEPSVTDSSQPEPETTEPSTQTVPTETEPPASLDLELPDTLELLAPAMASTAELRPEDFVRGLDGTGIQVSFAQPPVREPGVQDISLLFTADGKGCIRQTAMYCFALTETKVVDMAEGHVPNVRDFLEDTTLDSRFAEEGITLNRPGEVAMSLICDGRTYTVTYVVTESVPPVGTPKIITAQVGTLPDPALLLEQITDDSHVTVTWVETPVLTIVGIQDVTLLLTDSYGNTATVQSQIQVVPMENAPQFAGMEDIKIQVGDTISFKTGVTATDPQDGTVKFTVDAGNLDRNVAGRYTVYYSATDSDGNTTTMARTVVVQEIGEAVVEARAQEALAAIITEGMTRDEMIYAVWYYSRVNVKYVGSSDKSGIIAAAYEGFTTAQGDCYTYYAMNVVMLQMLGIESVEVRRYEGTSNHWWNLVQFEDGLWYHVDSCPSRIQLPEVNQSKMTETDLLVYTSNPDVMNRRPNYYHYDHSLPQYEGLNIAP